MSIDFINCSTVPGSHQQRGFTAIELMVVVAIMAILAALAAPSFNSLIQGWRVRQATEGMQSAIFLARSEAIKRNGNVVVQKIPNGTNGCSLAATTSDWGCGWYLCVDANADNKCNASVPVIQRFESISRTEVTRRSGGESLTFNRWGMPAAAFSFNFIPQDKSINDTSARGLCTSSGGRVSVTNNPPCVP